MEPKKLTRRLYIILVVAVLLIGGLYGAYKLFFDPYRGTITASIPSKYLYATLTKEQAGEDLAYLVGKLEERHPACMDGLPGEVRAQYEKELAMLTEDLTVLRLWQAGARILAQLKDAHTAIRYHSNDYQRLPIRLEMTEGRLLCIGQGYEDAEVIRINGISVEELYRRFLEQFSYELESYASYRFSSHICDLEYLEFIGVDVASGITFTFSNGNEEWDQSMTSQVPTQDTAVAKLPFVSYQIDEGKSLGIFTLRSCIADDVYRETVKEFFSKVKESSISNVVVDLRNNGGGNSQVINEFLRYVDIDRYSVAGGMAVRYGPILRRFKKRETKNKPVQDLLFTGRLFALTSTHTFSSAMMFALTLLDNNIGMVIGEIPGNMPACYGDILVFQTPNAKLSFTVSYKYFDRIDETKAELPLIPNYEVKAADAVGKLYQVIKAEETRMH